MTKHRDPLRILAVSAQWQGADDYAFVKSFRRDGHSVRVVNPKEYSPLWTGRQMKLARRFLTSRIESEWNAAILEEARGLRPDLLFVFKGAQISAETLETLSRDGTICIQFFPDVSFLNHGRNLPEALKRYHWIFTTKSFGVQDMKEQLGIESSSVLLHGFDPDTHKSLPFTQRDRDQYVCDVSFVGNSSAKKMSAIKRFHKDVPECDFRVWGPKSWTDLGKPYQGHPVFGLEFTKANALSRVNLGLLMEAQATSSHGDQVTSRTFHIPASGGFMLHERTEEAEALFEDEKECAFFDSPEDLADKSRFYLKHEELRAKIALAGRERCLASGYSIQNRARTIIDKYHELRSDGAGHV